MSETLKYSVRPGTIRTLSILCAIGGGLTILGLFLAPSSVWPNILIAAQLVIELGLGGIVFVAIMYVSNAGWSVVFRRVPESMSSILPIAGIVMVLMVFGIHTLYEWSHASAVAKDALLQLKSSYLNVPFFIARLVAYFIIWIAFARIIRRNSERQDEHNSIALTAKNVRWSAAFLVIAAITIWLASTDWVMSLEPHWFSTIFGMYHMAGVLLSGVAGVSLLTIVLHRRNAFDAPVREEHFHDLGKLLFAFSVFWMYIWFSQYLLIWYANIPEETGYFIRRENSGWLTFTVLNVLFNWLLPFIALLSAAAKRREGMLLKVSIIVLIGRWIDYYWMIAPPFNPDAPALGIWELAPVLALVAAFFLVTLKSFSKRNPVPINDPYLVESLNYHT
ncbi:MAG: hypothetical protein CL946_08570 [Ectothiorhodospiraceae bacterium]|nr:hypothetical protein [Ectothiorhodospiraceae bacterium]